MGISDIHPLPPCSSPVELTYKQALTKLCKREAGMTAPKIRVGVSRC